jgi:hypothetical protein
MEDVMSDTRYLSEMFNIQPPNWGLRGDPWLWQDMKQAFAETPFPHSSRELVADIRRIFKEKTGVELDEKARPYVEAYDHGGTSAGKVSGKWWLTTAMPLLIAMRDIAEFNMAEFDAILADGTSRFAFRSQPCTSH